MTADEKPDPGEPAPGAESVGAAKELRNWADDLDCIGSLVPLRASDLVGVLRGRADHLEKRGERK